MQGKKRFFRYNTCISFFEWNKCCICRFHVCYRNSIPAFTLHCFKVRYLTKKCLRHFSQHFMSFWSCNFMERGYELKDQKNIYYRWLTFFEVFQILFPSFLKLQVTVIYDTVFLSSYRLEYSNCDIHSTWVSSSN